MGLVHSLNSCTCPWALAKPMGMVMVWVTEVTKTMAIVKQGVNAIVRNCKHNVPAFNPNSLSLHTAFNK